MVRVENCSEGHASHTRKKKKEGMRQVAMEKEEELNKGSRGGIG
jgi:hypothetical protein